MPLKIYEAGITDIIAPYTPRWTGQTTLAATEKDALIDFESRGFYRNLTIREVVRDSDKRQVLNESQ